MIDRDTSNFLAFAAGKALFAISTLAVTVVVGRTLGPTGLGQWGLLVAAGALLHTSFVNWTHAGTVRFGCEEFAAAGTMRRTMSARAPLVLIGGAGALLVLSLQPFDWLERFYGMDGSLRWLVAVAAAGLWIAAETQAALQAVDRIRMQASVGAIAGIASLVAVYLVSERSTQLPTLVVAVFGTGGAIWGAAWIATLVRARVRWCRPTREEVWRQIRFGGPLLFAFTVGYLGIWGGHLLLRTLSSVEQVGYFVLASQIYLATVAANGMLSTLMLPRLVSGRMKSALIEQRYLETAVPTVFVLWTIGMLLLVAVLPFGLALVSGPGFTLAIGPALVLSVVIPGSVLTSLYSSLFSLQQRHGRLLAYSCLTVALNLMLCWLLIPHFGAVGAAIGTATAHAASQAAYLIDQHRRVGVSVTRVLPVWVTVLSLSGIQVIVPALGWRLLWAIAAVGFVAWMARRTFAVDAALIDRLFMGTLSPVATLLRRTLVGPGPRSLAHRSAEGHDGGTL